MDISGASPQIRSAHRPQAQHHQSQVGKPEPHDSSAGHDEAGDDKDPKVDDVTLSEEARRAQQKSGGNDHGLGVEAVKETHKAESDKVSGHRPQSPAQAHREEQKHSKQQEKSVVQRKSDTGGVARGGSNYTRESGKGVTREARDANAAGASSSVKPAGLLGGAPTRVVGAAKPQTDTSFSERRPPNRISRAQYLSNLSETFSMAE